MRDILLIERFANAAGKLERTVVSEGWIKPDCVELRNGELHFAFREPLEELRPRHGLLSGFLALSSASDEGVRAFALKWGPLYKNHVDYLEGVPTLTVPGQSGFDAVVPLETVDAWRSISTKVLTILKNASALQAHSIDGARRELAASVNLWLLDVNPQMVWDHHKARFTIRMRIGRLLDAIAMQLMLLIANKTGFALCQACGLPFETEGKRNTYCHGCGKEGAQRVAQRRRYAAKKQSRELHDRGVPASEIAEQVGRSVRQVRRWITN